MPEPTIYPFPKVLLAEVPCPILQCDRTIEVHASLLIREDDLEGKAMFQFGTLLDTQDLELHMIEHGMTPTVQEETE